MANQTDPKSQTNFETIPHAKKKKKKKEKRPSVEKLHLSL